MQSHSDLNAADGMCMFLDKSPTQKISQGFKNLVPKKASGPWAPNVL